MKCFIQILLSVLGMALLAVPLITAMGQESSARFESLGKVLVVDEFIFEEAPFAQCHASTIVEAADGTLVTAWFAGTKEGNGDVAIWSSRLVQGKWTAPVVIADAQEEGVPCWNPVLFQPENGPLCLFYKVSKTIPSWWGEMVISEDFGVTWKERSELPEGFLGPIKNKPIQIDDGTILCGSSTEHDGWRVHVERIPCLTKTWSKTEALNTSLEGGAIQPTLLTYPNGRIQMICRTRDSNGKLWQFQSTDNGYTWDKMRPLALPNPNSGVDGVTLHDKRQLLVYNHTTARSTPAGRSMLNVAISENGEDWSAVCLLEKETKGEFSYPAVIQTKDGKVHILYTWFRKRIRHIVLDPAKMVATPMIDAQWPEEVR